MFKPALEAAMAENLSEIEKIANDTERDYFMSGEEAKRYGLIDEVITRAPKSLKAVGSSDRDGAKDK